MLQHLREAHPELKGSLTTTQQVEEVFEMKVLKKHQSSLSRQIHGAIRIRRAGGAAINNKEEYSRCTIPTLEVPKRTPIAENKKKPDPTPEQAHQ